MNKCTTHNIIFKRTNKDHEEADTLIINKDDINTNTDDTPQQIDAPSTSNQIVAPSSTTQNNKRKITDKDEICEILKINQHFFWKGSTKATDGHPTKKKMKKYQDTFICEYRQAGKVGTYDFFYDELYDNCKVLLYNYFKDNKLGMYEDLLEAVENEVKAKKYQYDEKGRLKTSAGTKMIAKKSKKNNDNDNDKDETIPRRNRYITIPENLHWEDMIHTSGEEDETE